MVGLIHIAFTRCNFDQLSADAIWFAGTGFALVLLALLNWASWGAAHPNAIVGRAVLLVDIAMVILAGIAIPAVEEIQAYVLFVTITVLAFCGWRLEMRVKDESSAKLPDTR
jgi:hypothetical protein